MFVLLPLSSFFRREILMDCLRLEKTEGCVGLLPTKTTRCSFNYHWPGHGYRSKYSFEPRQVLARHHYRACPVTRCGRQPPATLTPETYPRACLCSSDRLTPSLPPAGSNTQWHSNWPIKKTPFYFIGVTDSPLCRGYMEAEETPQHLPMECRSVAAL